MRDFIDDDEYSIVGKVHNVVILLQYLTTCVVWLCVYKLQMLVLLVLSLGFFTSEDSKLKSAFMSAANALREDFKFGHTVSKDVAKQYELEE